MKMKNLHEAEGVENPPGIIRKTLAYNQEAMLCHFKLKKDAQIPMHSHRASQIGYVIRGKVRFLAEKPEDAFDVSAGDSYVFSEHVVHGADILEDAEFIEVFSPARDEYADFELSEI